MAVIQGEKSEPNNFVLSKTQQWVFFFFYWGNTILEIS